LPPDYYPNHPCQLSLPLRFVPSLLRFGEAVFTDGRSKPQEEKNRMMTFFSQLQKAAQHLVGGVIFYTSWPENGTVLLRGL